MTSIEHLRLPDYASTNEKVEEWTFGSSSTIKSLKYIYLDIESMDKNVFNDLPNLKSLHLRFTEKIPLFDFRHMSNLKEICLEYQTVFTLDYQGYLRSKLPKTIEKLSIIGFMLQLKLLKPLWENLKFLELCNLQDLVISESSHFNSFKHLTHLKIDDCSFSIRKSYGVDMKMIRFDLENLEELILYEIGHFDGKFHFGNLPKLKMLHANSFDHIDFNSIKSLVNLEDLEMRCFEDTGRRVNKHNDGENFWKLTELKDFLNDFPKLKKLNVDGVDKID